MMDIIRRKDGTFIVQHNGMPYHVVSREIDPGNAFNIDEVREYASQHPEDVREEQDPVPKPLSDVKKEAKDTLEKLLVKRRANGFPYNGSVWQGDEGAQLNMASLLNLVSLGATGPFLWRDLYNVNHQMTVTDLQALAGPMANFIQTCFMETWAAKSAVDAATTEAEIQAIVAAEEAK